jgi:hypothetical protein
VGLAFPVERIAAALDLNAVRAAEPIVDPYRLSLLSGSVMLRQ